MRNYTKGKERQEALCPDCRSVPSAGHSCYVVHRVSPLLHSNMYTQHSEPLTHVLMLWGICFVTGEQAGPFVFISLPRHTHSKTQKTQGNTHTCSKHPTVRGWGQVCSSSSMIPEDSWDVAVDPLLYDSASVRRCLSPHHSASFSFLCSPRPLSALPLLLLLLSDPLLQRGGGSEEVSLISNFLVPQKG